MAAERLPLEQRLVRREASITEDISGLGAFKSALSDFQRSLTAVNSPSTFEQRNTSSSDSAAVSVTAASTAALSSYSVTVDNLAQAQALVVRGAFDSVNQVVGTGTLDFTFGTTGYTADAGSPPNSLNDTYDSFVEKAGVASKSVTIDATNNTLSGVRDAINTADIGISAAIVNDGDAYRLVIQSQKTGAENSISISVADSGDGNHTDGNGLSRLSFNASVGASNVYQTIAATDASFTVNGLDLTSEGNVVSSAINGLTLNLKKTTTSPVTVTVADNTSGIKTAITKFVEGYNSYFKILTDLTAYDSKTGARGLLQGDFSTRSISGQIRIALSAAAEGFKGEYSRLAEIGITSSSSGQLQVDDSRLNAALAGAADDVQAVLTRFANIQSGGGLSVNSFSDKTKAGTYEIEVSSLATSGKLMATVPSDGFPVTIDSSKDSFVVTVDGVASGTVTLTNQAYGSLSAIASEIQNKINADATLRSAEKSITVSVAGDDIEIRSNSVGSASTVALANAGSDSTIAALGLSLATTTSGTDLAATINGVAAIGSGNNLKGASGTDASGLSIDVSSTQGGVVVISNGVADQLDTLLTTLLGDSSPIDSRITGLNARADLISGEREIMERRLEVIEKRYRLQFNSLDALLSNLSNTGTYVAQQLANIPVPGVSKK
jgi:flagellar hook-associated protein 2